MRRAQDRARSARSRKNGARSATIEYNEARSATIKSPAPGALKLASEAKTIQIKNLFYFLISGHLSLILHQRNGKRGHFSRRYSDYKKGIKNVYQFKMFTLTCKNIGIKIVFALRNKNVLKKCQFHQNVPLRKL